MNPAWIAQLVRLPARQLHLLGAGLLLCAGAALWFYALRAPLAGLRALRAEQARLEAARPDPRPLAAQMAALERDIAALGQRFGPATTGSATQRQVALIGAISRLAATHGVELEDATPATAQPSQVFEQDALDAVAAGPYGALLEWIEAIESAAPTLAITGFEMDAGKTAGQVAIKLRIAAYRPEGTP